MPSQTHQLAAIMLVLRNFSVGGLVRDPWPKAMVTGDRNFSVGGLALCSFSEGEPVLRSVSEGEFTDLFMLVIIRK